MRLNYRIVSYGAGRDIIDHVQQVHQMIHQMQIMGRRAPGASAAWQPTTDVYETDEALVVRVELAGVREGDIDITLFADHLAITATRHRDDAPSAAYYMANILYGEFRLAVPIVGTIQRDNVEATHDDGMLTVMLPKSVEQRIEPRTIQASSAHRTVVDPASQARQAGDLSAPRG